MACKHVPIIASRILVRGKLVFRGLVTVTLSNFLSEYPNMNFPFILREKCPTQEILSRVIPKTLSKTIHGLHY